MVYTDGVEAAELSFRSGCSCDEPGHDCQFRGCSCLEDIEEEEDPGSQDDSDGTIYAYHANGRDAGLLRTKLLDSRGALFECHESCACSKSCPNRVVERGRTVPLQVFKTTNRGWGKLNCQCTIESTFNNDIGVRCSEPIKKGQFVDCYIGEVITPQEADKRRRASDLASQKDVYLFALDKFSDPESHDLRLKGRSLEVDGEFMSGPTRFINHSCDPNLRIFARVGDHADKHLHDLALFAIKDINKSEELTFDYVDGVADDNENNIDTEKMTRCLCGSANCRKFLW